MIPVSYIEGDATRPRADGNRIIAHVCNDVGGWGKGFVLALSRRSPEPERAYRQWYADRKQNDFGLGAVQLVSIAPDTWVANMIGQHGTAAKGRTGIPAVRYEAIDRALMDVARHALTLAASVHMARIGCGLAGGTWVMIEPLISARLCEHDIAVSVYDLV